MDYIDIIITMAFTVALIGIVRKINFIMSIKENGIDMEKVIKSNDIFKVHMGVSALLFVIAIICLFLNQ